MADPSLILDRRAALAGKPGLHAVLIGVSEYANLPSADDPPGDGLAALRRLRSSAISAYGLFQKLQALDADGRLVRPLATVRLLHSPAPEELAKEPALAAIGGAPATRSGIAKALDAWRTDVATARDNQAFFYFCGHGIRRSLEESILLAADFLEPGSPKLFNSFRLSNVRNGMVPGASFPEIGREQFYFVDACREKPDALDTLDTTETPKIFDAELGGLDDRRAPIFFATMTGGVAAGLAAQPTFFANALIWAMDNGSFGSRTMDNLGVVWPVTAPSLKVGIEASDALFDSRVELTGLVADPVLCFRRDPPRLPLKVALAPEPLPAPVKTLSLTEMNTRARLDISPSDHAGPLSVDVSAGMYQMTVKPRSKLFQRVRSDILFLSIQSKMPLIFDLGAVP
ncbi:caspase family protein [Sphingomonas tabacisoli]|uniref:Caspase family protein n=1 Tax=Sphingomonas tabacisoli TaxID=2249466 RepID=A0ABW4HZV1_9SPHN